MDLADHRPPLALDCVTPLRAVAREALASCHTDLLAARQTVLSSRDPDGVHHTRVALRRLRAAATLFGRALHDETILALRADAKQLASACGATRDLDVFMAGVLADAEHALEGQADMADELRSFRAAALRLRRTRHDAVRRVLASEIFAVFDARLAGVLAAPPQPAPAPPLVFSAAPGRDATEVTLLAPAPNTTDFARDVLRRRHRKLRRKLNHLDALDARKRHALRLRVKKHRYAASFLATLFDRKAADAYIHAAAGLQDALGLANDRVVASKMVADVRGAARPKGRLDWVTGVLAGWLAVRVSTSDKDDRAVAAAGKRLTRAPRFWRGGARGQDEDEK